MKYFTGRPPLSKERGKYPQEVQAQQLLDDLRKNDPAKWALLEKAVHERVSSIEEVKGGYCRLPMPNLGIIVTQIGIGPIVTDGQTSAAADAVVVATQGANVKTITTNNFRDRVKTILKINGNDEKNAVETIQLMDRLITKEVKEDQFAIRADTLQKILEILTQYLPKKTANDPQAILALAQSLLDGPAGDEFINRLKTKLGL
jgi:hypothetical protein